MILERKSAFILIFAIWVLGFLTVLAVGIAAGIRQKIVLLEKLDQRSRIGHISEATVKYATQYISNQLSLNSNAYTVSLKANLHNNPNIFGNFELGEDSASISHKESSGDVVYGVVDEEGKININTSTLFILERLIQRVLLFKPDEAKHLAESILDWRKFGESQVVGFFSEGYYNNLEYPYPKKDADYEILDELLLVKGMNKEAYSKLINYLTIYGDGKVNINTASAEVLYALGLEDPVIEKILEARRGKDNIESTVDDHAFFKTFDIASEVNMIVKLLPDDIRIIDGLNKENLLTTNSYYFTISAQIQLAHSIFSKKIRAIYSSRDNRILYWFQR